ncbi:MAG: bifunctional oligoribonuclease/PAP phosphatase NrnA [Deltaproteobacteria bacterium]|nr:bifunctional oligoribonuclease/PAP phosphatase NrnA [Deltaproteobacteria bacterium]
MNREWGRLCELIQRRTSFVVVSHKNPDGDAIGSSLAMGRILRKKGKQVEIFNATPIPGNFTFLPDAELIKPLKETECEVLIALDCADFQRTGFDDSVRERVDVVVNIDHHETNTHFGDINIVDSDAAAVGCLMWQFVKYMNFPVDKDLATQIYAAILTDTGSFRYLTTTPKVLRTAAEILEYGVDPWYVAFNIYEERRLSTLRLLGLALSTLETYCDGKLALMCVTQKMYKETGTQTKSTEGFVNFARAVKGSEVGVLLREDEPSLFRVSIRSKGNMDVSQMAALFGGGGHKNASGCEIGGSLDEVKEKIIRAFSKVSNERCSSHR